MISTTSTREDAPKVLIDAEVTSIETEYGAHGTLAVVRGYDRSHRLAAGRKSRPSSTRSTRTSRPSWPARRGSRPDVDESEGTHDHVFQANQSDLDFLSGLARQIGYDCRVDGENLLFKKLVESSSGPGRGRGLGTNPTALVWGDDLLDFRARVSAVPQVSKVEVRGWDPAQKKEIIGTAEATAKQRRPAHEADGSRREGSAARRTSSSIAGVGSQQVADQMAHAASAADRLGRVRGHRHHRRFARPQGSASR